MYVLLISVLFLRELDLILHFLHNRLLVVRQLNARCEVCSFSHFRDIEGFQKLIK